MSAVTSSEDIDWNADDGPNLIAASVFDDEAKNDAGDTRAEGISVQEISSCADTPEMDNLQE